MRVFVFIILFFYCAVSAFSQGEYHQMEFPGGNEKLTEYLKREFVESEEDKAKGLKGTILVSFKVDQSGRVIDIKVIKALSEPSTKEALRVIAQMPKWIASTKINNMPETIMLIPIKVGS